MPLPGQALRLYVPPSEPHLDPIPVVSIYFIDAVLLHRVNLIWYLKKKESQKVITFLDSNLVSF